MAIHGLQMGVILTTYDTWDDPPSKPSFLGKGHQGIKGQLGVPLRLYPWYLLCSLGIFGDYNP